MKISVIIPVRNEEQSIAQLLDSLNNQTVKPSEIVITDAGSVDRTGAIIAAYDQARVPIHLIRVDAALPGRARNLAAAQATKEWLAFIDAGVLPELDWLERLAERAQAGEGTGETGAIAGGDVDVVYGTYEPVTDTRFKLCVAMATIPPPRELAGKPIRARSIVSALMKRSVWESVGGFPEDLRSAEDLLFMNRIDEANFRTVNAPDALVHWQMQATPWLTCKRFITYSRHNLRAGLWRQWQAPIFKRYALLIASALPIFLFGVRWLFATLLLWLAMLVARGAVAIWRNRFCYPGSVLENVARILVLTPLIAMLDAATFLGTLQWTVKDKLRL